MVVPQVATYRAFAAGPQSANSLDAFREHYCRALLRLEMTPAKDHPLTFDVTVRATADIALATGTISPMVNHHPAELGDDSLMFSSLRSGVAEFRVNGHLVDTPIGGGTLAASADAGSYVSHTATRLTNIRCRRDLLSEYLVDTGSAIGRQVSPDNYALRLLFGYADVLADPAVAIDDSALRMVTENIYGLTALALGGARDTPVLTRSVRAARLRAIKRDIAHSFREHDLSIGQVARRHSISASYLRQMFASEGMSFADCVLEHRLTAARRMLMESRFSDVTVSAIALEVGFSDLSYFNRAFRRRYGATPSDVRASRP